MTSPTPQITLRIQETNVDGQRIFSFQVFLNGTMIAGSHVLTPQQSSTVYDIASSYNVLFELPSMPRLAIASQRAIGDQLFTLWLGDVWERVQSDFSLGMSVMLIIASDAPVALNLPWELMRLPGYDFAGYDARLSIRRLPQLATGLRSFSSEVPAGPLHVLSMVCAPQDQAALDYEREEAVLFDALDRNSLDVIINSGYLGTFDELRECINQFRPHVVHLTGHAIVARRCPSCEHIVEAFAEWCPSCGGTALLDDPVQGYFAFEDERGQTDLHSAQELAQQIFAVSGVQCAFLSGCQSGKAPPVEALAGLCQGLVAHGVPLVIGWTASIDDTLATQFARTFYGALASDQSIDRALTQARQTLRATCDRQSDPSWTLPVLYAASIQTHVFDAAKPRQMPPRRPTELLPLPGMIEGYVEHFVGRRREIQRLLPDLRKCSGPLRSIFLTGIGGAGKSALATLLARKLETYGFVPIAIPSTEQQPLTATALLQRCGDAFRDTARRREAQGHRVLAEELRAAARELERAELSVDQRLRDIVGMLNHSEVRFVLVLDNFEVNLDAQTCAILDPYLQTFVPYLLKHLAGKSRLIITSRCVPADAMPLPCMVRQELLGDVPYTTFLKLLLCDPSVEKRYRSGELAGALLRELHRLLGGTPRFLKQLHAVVDRISAADLQVSLQQFAHAAGASTNALLSARDHYCAAITTARLYGGLSMEAQRALSQAAVYSVAVPLEGLVAVTGLAVDQLRAYTRAWQQAALIYPDRDSGSSELWVVYGILRDWLLAPERLDPAARAIAHRAAGDYLSTLEQQNHSNDLRLSLIDCLQETRVQYLAAGAYTAAQAVVDRLSELLTRRGSYSDVQHINEEQLAYAPQYINHNWVGRSLAERGQYADARLAHEQALRLVQQNDDLAGEAGAWHCLGTLDLLVNDYDAAHAKFDRALIMARQLGNLANEAAALHQLATIDLELGYYKDACEQFQSLMELWRQLGDVAGEAATLQQLAMVELYQGNDKVARNYLRLAQRIWQQLNDQSHTAGILHIYALLDLRPATTDMSPDKFYSALATKQRIEDQAGEAAIWRSLALHALDRNDWNAARDKFQRALALYQTIKNWADAADVLHQLAAIDLRTGNLQATLTNLKYALELHQQSEDQLVQIAA